MEPSHGFEYCFFSEVIHGKYRAWASSKMLDKVKVIWNVRWNNTLILSNKFRRVINNSSLIWNITIPCNLDWEANLICCDSQKHKTMANNHKTSHYATLLILWTLLQRNVSPCDLKSHQRFNATTRKPKCSVKRELYDRQ